MIRIEETVVIERPTSHVWAYITNPENDTVWMSNVLDFKADWDNQPRVGDTTRRIAKAAGRLCEFTTEITDVDGGEMFEWKSIEARARCGRAAWPREPMGIQGCCGRLPIDPYGWRVEWLVSPLADRARPSNPDFVA